MRDRTGVRIQEAFMVRTHPQWLQARELVRAGGSASCKAIQRPVQLLTSTDPTNIRNVAEWGGGGLLDIGCYPITTSRFVTGPEPRRVAAVIERDPATRHRPAGLGAARLSAACSAASPYGTQLVPRQTMQFLGTKGRLEVEIPFNAPNDRPCRLLLYDDGPGSAARSAETIELPTCDQYGIMGDAFAAAILDGTPQPVPLEDSLANMRVIDAVFRAGESGTWETP